MKIKIENIGFSRCLKFHHLNSVRATLSIHLSTFDGKKKRVTLKEALKNPYMIDTCRRTILETLIS